ncbi:MAG TPA: DUF521 domain-containing protein [Clostridia bacterium]|nr:DUF521 domain-containing protein [Clostridia bacterium]
MKLEKDEIELLEGKRGALWQKIIKSVILYGEIFGAEKLVPIEGTAHFVTSFGANMIKPYFDILDELINAGIKNPKPFTVDPRPFDPINVKYSLLERIIFNFIYGKQKKCEEQLQKLGILNEKAYSCTCYLEEIGNIPEKGQILAWSESSAVVYVNSVIGARTNRNSAGIDVLCNVLGKAPYFGFLTEEGRKANWLIKIQVKKLPNPQLLGSAIGLTVMEDVPYIVGLSDLIGTELNEDVKDYLKDLGAAAASNGAVGLYHIENLTPEAKEHGRELLRNDYSTYVIDEKELEKVYSSYPLLWKKENGKPQICFIGCPHCSLNQIYWWFENIKIRIKEKGKLNIITYICAALPVIDKVKNDKKTFEEMKKIGIKLTSICPLMYMNNPICSKKRVITNSNKLRTYSTARFYPDEELLEILTKD